MVWMHRSVDIWEILVASGLGHAHCAVSGGVDRRDSYDRTSEHDKDCDERELGDMVVVNLQCVL